MEYQEGQLEIKTGYWQTVNKLMVPYGKFNWKQMTQDGEVKTKCPDGLYCGVQDGYRVRIVYCPSKF
jgi:hypothetical protein